MILLSVIAATTVSIVLAAALSSRSGARTAPAPAPRPAPPRPAPRQTIWDWIAIHASQYIPRLKRAIGPVGTAPTPASKLKLCRALVSVLPGGLLDKLGQDFPALAPQLRKCEKELGVEQQQLRDAAAERARLEAEQQAREAAEQQQLREAAERARLAAEQQAGDAAEQQQLREAAERARLAAEEQTRADAAAAAAAAEEEMERPPAPDEPPEPPAPPVPSKPEPAADVIAPEPAPPPELRPRQAAELLWTFVATALQEGRYADLGTKDNPSPRLKELQALMKRIKADGWYGSKTRARGKELLGREFPIRRRQPTVRTVTEDAPQERGELPPLPDPPAPPTPAEPTAAAVVPVVVTDTRSPKQAALDLLKYVRGLDPGLSRKDRAIALGTTGMPNATVQRDQAAMGEINADGWYAYKTRSRGRALTGITFPPRG